MRVSEDIARLDKLLRGDSHVYKELTRDQVLRAVEGMSLRYWGPRPLLHQRIATLACLEHASYLLLLDKGLGKSKVLLDVFSYLWERRLRLEFNHVNKGLILCPNQTLIEGWGEQIETHAPWANYMLCPASLDKAGEVKREFMRKVLDDEDHQLVVIDYPSLQTMLCKRVGKKPVLVPELCEQLGRKFQFVVLDEIHGVKDRKTLRFEILLELMAPIHYRYGATATIFNQDPFDTWAQAYLLDGGVTFGTTPTAFRHFFCKDKYDPFARNNRVSVFDEDKRDLFNEWLRGMSIRYLINECVDLPNLRRVRPELEMSTEQRIVYRQVLQEVRDAKKKDPEARVNAWQKLRRVMSGFIPYESEYIPMSISPKMEWLKQKVRQWNEPVVLFYEFTATGQQINQHMSEIVGSDRVGWLWSGTKDKQKVMELWKRGSVDILVIQNTVGAAGLNLQRSRRQVFYECPTSAIIRSQAESRIWRLGQERACFLYDLFFSHTVEERVFSRVYQGIDLHRAVVDGIEESDDE